MDVAAEREKITREIRELERILDPGSASIAARGSGPSPDSDSGADSPCNEDSDATSPLISEDERWAEASNDEDDAKEKALPEDPETCLQLNMVYQEVIQEKLAELSLLLAQNREQQEELAWDLAGSKGPRAKDGRSLPPNTYIGHFMKPYFKDRVTGVGPPANEDTREKAAQGIKAFEELLVTKWKSWERTLLRKSVVSGRLQRLLQPKLLKLEYLHQKQSRVSGEVERQVLEKQAREAEREVQEINQLPEEALLGDRLDSHDWDKIANVNFEGGRGAEEIRKFWQNCEHPSINKQEWGAQEVEQLKALAARHGCLDWQRIAEELGTRRSAFQCLQKYQQHSPALKRREWTEAEDRMLSQLVQEMRVGSHIPYRRIVYYMEGRDSMQLIYRWTKSLDPGLKKGSWAPEEDAKLLQAVAKYGEQDWFKIREEVPGRSDAQCRDRYLRRLHFSLKKGRWNSKEEEKLLELIEKHGAGHWAKIAAELPHRTGSQCLSKWKVMVRKQSRGRRRRRRPLRSVCWSSSSGDSGGDGGGSGDSEDSEDSETEATPEAQEDGRALPPAQHLVPDMGLWVPARLSARQPWRGGAGAWPGRPAPGARTTQGGLSEAGATAPATAGEVCQAQTLPGPPIADPRAGTSPHSVDARLQGAEDSPDEGGRLQVPLATELQVLRANATPGCRPPKQQLRRPCLPGCPPGASPGGGSVARPCGQQPRRGHTLRNRLLDRQLLTAVSPWVGDSALPRPPLRPLRAYTRADGVREQLQEAHLASTPVFALFIQLFQIDTAGCMEVVRERREPPRPQQAPASAPRTPGSLLPDGPTREAGQSSASHRGGGTPQACGAAAPPAQTPLPAPGGPRPKPKTVSELLREKRLREARARRAAQGPAVPPPPLLLSAPLLLRPAAPAAAGPSATSRSEGPSVLPAFTLATAAARTPAAGSAHSTPAVPRGSAPGPERVPEGCLARGVGRSQAPASCRKQGLPELLPVLPAASSPSPLPARPLSLTPALDVCEGMPHAVAGTALSVTWVLTAQGLLPVPAVLGLPGPAAPSAPKALVVALSPGLTETQADQGRQLLGQSLPGQLLATRDTGSHLAPSTGLSALPASSSQNPAEADTDTARAPGGPSCPGEAGASAVPSMSSQAAHLPECPPCSSEGPPGYSSSPGSGAGETAGTPTAAGAPQGPLGPERPPSAQPGPEKGALDLGLLSRQSEASVRDWLRAQRGVCVPPLGRRLPYQPPALCSLRALAGLLLQKRALEGRAGSLTPGGAAGTLPAALGWVRDRLQDSPAYLQLKARFLAAFTLPALLATLPPHGVPTTLSATPRAPSESEDEGLERSASPAPAQGVPAAAGGTAPPSPDGADHPDVLRTRHARHARKRSRPE